MSETWDSNEEYGSDASSNVGPLLESDIDENEVVLHRLELEDLKAKILQAKDRLKEEISHLEWTKSETSRAKGGLAYFTRQLTKVSMDLGSVRAEIWVARQDYSKAMKDLGHVRGEVQEEKDLLEYVRAETQTRRQELGYVDVQVRLAKSDLLRAATDCPSCSVALVTKAYGKEAESGQQHPRSTSQLQTTTVQDNADRASEEQPVSTAGSPQDRTHEPMQLVPEAESPADRRRYQHWRDPVVLFAGLCGVWHMYCLVYAGRWADGFIAALLMLGYVVV